MEQFLHYIQIFRYNFLLDFRTVTVPTVWYFMFKLQSMNLIYVLMLNIDTNHLDYAFVVSM